MANEQKTAKIREALKQLDPLNAKHWTDDGLPRESVVRDFASDQSFSRKDISEAFPGFQRTKPKGDAPAEGSTETTAPADIDPLTGDTPQRASPEVIRERVRAMTTPTAESLDGDLTKNTGEPMTEDEVRDVLEDRVHAAETALADAQQGVRDAHKLVETRREELAHAREQLAAEFPPLSPAENIKQFIASEQQMREARVNGGRAPARIDLVMQRSNSRGWRRPNRHGPAQTRGPGTSGATAA